MTSEISKLAIHTVLGALNQHQLLGLQSLVGQMLSDGKSYAIHSQLTSLIGTSPFDSCYRTIAILACKLARAIAVSSEPIQETAPHKELVWLSKTIASFLSDHAVANEGNGKLGQTPTPPEQSGQVKQDFETTGIIKVYQAFLGRTPTQKEINIWKRNLQNRVDFSEFVVNLSQAKEAGVYKRSTEILPDESDGRFIQFAYEAFYNRGCTGREISHWENKLRNTSRRSILNILFSEFVKSQQEAPVAATQGPMSCRVMGTHRFISIDDWLNRSMELETSGPVDSKNTENAYTHRFYIKSEPKFLVTAIASLYKGASFIEQFMDNIVSQSCFKDYCELIIVDANSPDNEYDVIKRYLSSHRGINYIRTNYRIGIYDAWNVAIEAARGNYLTNTNLDDLRRRDSLELQAGVLDNLPFVDVVYQDFYYSFESPLSFERIAEFGYESNLPVVTSHNMMEFNSPHNAPMWRKHLHHELGYFDTSFSSAGDYEFWMRCLAAGKVFYKLNDPHVAYFQNPHGMSTRSNTRGIVEANEISRKYARKLVSDDLIIPFEQFCEKRLFQIRPDEVPSKNRYTATQKALRGAARAFKYSPR